MKKEITDWEEISLVDISDKGLACTMCKYHS